MDREAWCPADHRVTKCWTWLTDVTELITSIQDYWRSIALIIWTFISKEMSLFKKYTIYICDSFSFKEQESFNIMFAVTIHSDFWAQENTVCHFFHCSPIYLPWSDGTGCQDPVSWMLSFKPAFSFSSFTFIKTLFSSSSLSAIVQYIIAICLRPINEKTKILIQIYLTSEAFYSLTHLNRLCPKGVYFLAG